MQETFDIGGDLTVNRLGFGAMRLCADGIIGAPDDEANARAVVERALELGVDFIDTADSYGPGTSERLLREAGAPAEAVVATKAGLLREAGGDWLPHGDPDYVRNQALVSRDRLGVDTIDLYQFHRPDPDADFAESVQAFAELKDEGFVRHVGLSNVTVDQLEQARDVVEVATVQNQYNVAHRPEADERVLDACEEYDIGFIPWYPLAAGDLDSVEGIDAIAERHDATPHQIALAWTLHRSDVMLPIPGTSSVEHLEANVAAGDIELGDEEMARLDAA
ncbi:oxidoreductase [Halobacteriales archaeon QH_7_66_36]|nr:MAG: oxidoreductase [Halobacteriales archaeon QH_7_66_36]